jgi:hypothetical protein
MTNKQLIERDIVAEDEKQRFREVMCRPQEHNDILLWRKDIEGSSTDMILAVENYWIERMHQALKRQREEYDLRYCPHCNRMVNSIVKEGV